MKVLITGGTGSLGSRLCAHLLEQGHSVSILSRNAHRQADLKVSLPLGEVDFHLGDIADPYVVQRAMRGCNIVVHAAAQKRIERGDSDAAEYIRTNITGTQVVADVAAWSPHVLRAIFISSDKAAQPLNQYGATKMVAERFWINQPGPFVAIRYGNVVSSNGSVWHLWKRQVAQNIPIVVRSPEPTRFIVPMSDAVSFVMDAMSNGSTNCTLVPPSLSAFSVWDLAREIQPDDFYWQVDRYQPGEKQHETLLAPGEEAVPLPIPAHDAPIPLLWRVQQTHYNCYSARFHSEMAPRLTGQEVVRMLDANHS